MRNPLSRLKEECRRMAHTRGHSVHSPFAYETVREVVRPDRRYEYYGYFDIDAALTRSPGDRTPVRRLIDVREKARLLLRLAARMRPASVYLPPQAHRAMKTALEAAAPKALAVSAPRRAADCDIIVACGHTPPADTIAEALRRPGTAALLLDAPDGAASAIFDSLAEGVMLDGRSTVLVFSREMMEKTRITVKFR